MRGAKQKGLWVVWMRRAWKKCLSNSYCLETSIRRCFFPFVNHTSFIASRLSDNIIIRSLKNTSLLSWLTFFHYSPIFYLINCRFIFVDLFLISRNSSEFLVRFFSTQLLFRQSHFFPAEQLRAPSLQPQKAVDSIWVFSLFLSFLSAPLSSIQTVNIRACWLDVKPRTVVIRMGSNQWR